MERIIRRAVRKLEEEYDGSYVGFITSQDLLHLVGLGMVLEYAHKQRVQSAKYNKQAGLCYSYWCHFLKPKKPLIEQIHILLPPEEY